MKPYVRYLWLMPLFIATGVFLIAYPHLMNLVRSHQLTDVPQFKTGVLDAGEILFNEDKVIPLEGDWAFYPDQLLTPKETENLPPSLYLHLPTDLTDLYPHRTDSFGTLRGQIKVSDPSKTYMLKVKYFSTANKIYIDGKEMMEIGNVATTKEDFQPYMTSELIAIHPEDNTIDVVIQYANFYHTRILFNMLYFGEFNAIERYTDMNIIKDSLLLGSLFLISLSQIFIFVIAKRGRNHTFLYLGLWGLLLCMRLGIVNERILVRLFPAMTAEVLMKFGFLPVLLFVPLLILYMLSVFDIDDWPRFKMAIQILSALLIILVSFTNVRIYDPIFDYSFPFLVLLGLVTSVAIIRKITLTPIERNVMGLSILILLITGTNDYIREFTEITLPETMSIGFVLFITLQAFYLLWDTNLTHEHIEELAQENSQMLAQISRLNEELEVKIQDRTKELKEANAKLTTMSYTDGLTGVFNRRAFDLRIEALWDQGLMSHTTVGILMLDIDDFKLYNDYFGHLQGDECLIQMGMILSDFSERNKCYAARYGGEEFALLLTGCDSETMVQKAGDLLEEVEAMAIPTPPESTSEHLTISVGINLTLPENKGALGDFIRTADERLYQAKKAGKNRFCFGGMNRSSSMTKSL